MPDMRYQIIDTVMARAIQANAVRAHLLFGWIIMMNLPECPGSIVAGLVIDVPTPYILWPASPTAGVRRRQSGARIRAPQGAPAQPSCGTQGWSGWRRPRPGLR
jgi:hypothetical protein